MISLQLRHRHGTAIASTGIVIIVITTIIIIIIINIIL